MLTRSENWLLFSTASFQPLCKYQLQFVSRWGNTITAGLKNRTYNGTFNKSEANYETHDCVRLRAWLHIWGEGDLVSSSLAVSRMTRHNLSVSFFCFRGFKQILRRNMTSRTRLRSCRYKFNFRILHRSLGCVSIPRCVGLFGRKSTCVNTIICYWLICY